MVELLPTGTRRVGSGLLIDDKHVVTASHCVGAGARHGSAIEIISYVEGVARPGHIVALDLEHDVAVLALHTSAESIHTTSPAVVFGRLDRTRAGELQNCEAVGFPAWQEDVTKALRGGAEVRGTIRLTEGLETDRLVLRDPLLTDVSSGERLRAASARESPWRGLSGAVVHHGGLAVGVIVAHHPRQGAAAFTVQPFDALLGASASEVSDVAGVPALTVAQILGLSPGAGLPEIRPDTANALRPIYAQAPSSHDSVVDRPALEAEIYALLEAPELPVVLRGEPGTGKTILATKVAHRIAGPEGTILIRGGQRLQQQQSNTVYASDLLRCLLAAGIGAESWSEPALELGVGSLLARGRPSTVVVLDDVPADALERVVPATCAIPTIITSRRSVQVGREIVLRNFERAEAIEAIVRTAPAIGPRVARRVAELLDDRPLAVVLAARLVTVGRLTPAELVSRIEAEPVQALEAANAANTTPRPALIAVYREVLAEVDQDPYAGAILRRMAWFTTAPLTPGALRAIADTSDEASASLEFDVAVARLRSVGLVVGDETAASLNDLTRVILRGLTARDLPVVAQGLLRQIKAATDDTSQVPSGAQVGAVEREISVTRVLLRTEMELLSAFLRAVVAPGEIGALDIDEYTWLMWQRDIEWFEERSAEYTFGLAEITDTHFLIWHKDGRRRSHGPPLSTSMLAVTYLYAELATEFYNAQLFPTLDRDAQRQRDTQGGTEPPNDVGRGLTALSQGGAVPPFSTRKLDDQGGRWKWYEEPRRDGRRHVYPGMISNEMLAKLSEPALTLCGYRMFATADPDAVACEDCLHGHSDAGRLEWLRWVSESVLTIQQALNVPATLTRAQTATTVAWDARHRGDDDDEARGLRLALEVLVGDPASSDSGSLANYLLARVVKRLVHMSHTNPGGLDKSVLLHGRAAADRLAEVQPHVASHLHLAIAVAYHRSGEDSKALASLSLAQQTLEPAREELAADLAAFWALTEWEVGTPSAKSVVAAAITRLEELGNQRSASQLRRWCLP